jgi:Cytochrome P460
MLRIGRRSTFHLAFAIVGLAAIVGVSAEAADDLKLPTGYRYWFHVNTAIVTKDSPLYAVIGGMHNVHVNSTGEAALKKGGPYPDGTIFLVDLHDYSLDAGTYSEGPIKGVALMQKDAAKYAATGGWGFEFWAGGDPQKPIVKDPVKECFECHQSKKDQDYVFSTYIP